MKKKKNLLLVIALLLVGIIGIGYATLTANLTINGTANVSATTWNVHLTNPVVTSGSASTTAPTVSTDGTTATFTVDLKTPGEFYEFTIDAVNTGTIDANLGAISVPTLTADQQKYLTVTTTQLDSTGTEVTSLVGEKLDKTSGKQSFKVRVEYKKNLVASDLPSADQEITLTLKTAYCQYGTTCSLS